MTMDSLSERLGDALTTSGMSPAALASKIGKTEATVSNWLNDKVQAQHAKAAVLLKISAALGVRPEWLLLGQGSRSVSFFVNDSIESHPVKTETLKIALQLVAETLQESGVSLPPEKQAEVISLTYELLEEGMPRAKVLRFARAAAA